MKVLLADDDPQILRALRITLGARGYEVTTASDGRPPSTPRRKIHPDLVVLDLGMPGLTGIEVIEALRGWTPVPILVVSGRTESWDKVEALDAGADDYVTKPFAGRRAARAHPGAHPTRTRGLGRTGRGLRRRHRRPVGTRRGDRAGATVRLTPTEWKLLEVLVRNPGRLVTRETLLTEVWGPQYTTDTGYLRLYLSQLRKKLEPEPSAPRYLLTEAGMGYRFMPDAKTEVGPEGLEPPTSSV